MRGRHTKRPMMAEAGFPIYYVHLKLVAVLLDERSGAQNTPRFLRRFHRFSQAFGIVSPGVRRMQATVAKRTNANINAAIPGSAQRANTIGGSPHKRFRQSLLSPSVEPEDSTCPLTFRARRIFSSISPGSSPTSSDSVGSGHCQRMTSGEPSPVTWTCSAGLSIARFWRLVNA